MSYTDNIINAVDQIGTIINGNNIADRSNDILSYEAILTNTKEILGELGNVSTDVSAKVSYYLIAHIREMIDDLTDAFYETATREALENQEAEHHFGLGMSKVDVWLKNAELEIEAILENKLVNKPGGM